MKKITIALSKSLNVKKFLYSQKNFFLCVLSIILLLNLVLNIFHVSNTHAYALPENIKVGLYFGTNARDNMKISYSEGLFLGYYQGTAFTPVWRSIGGDGVIIRKDTYFAQSSDGANGIAECSSSDGAKWGPYHLQYFSNINLDEAPDRIAELKSNGINAYIAVIGLAYNIWSGNYVSMQEAEAAKTASAVQCTVREVSDRRINVMDAKTKETIMIFGHMELGLGVRPIPSEGEQFTINTKAVTHYRGGLDFKRLDGGNLTVVNIVDIEHYLYLVVAREMSAAWHNEALKAQAVCARNYAVSNINKHKSSGFDLCNDVHCQAYMGLDGEDQRCISAVEETRGKVLMYDGKPAETFFSSSMGQYTDDVKNVWGTHYPYLVSVENKYENTENIPNGVWSGSVTKAQATDRMNKRGYNLGTVTNIEAIEYSPAGNVVKLKVTGTGGSKVFEGEGARTAFGDITLSQRYTVTNNGGVSGVDSDNITVISGDGKHTRSVQNTTIIGGDGNIKTFDLGSFFVLGDTVKKSYKSEVVVTGGGDTFYFSGQGWGNPVGMSQYGAKGMAEAGFTYDQILTHYFKGTYLE